MVARTIVCRSLFTAVALATALAVLSAPSFAGTYDVTSCNTNAYSGLPPAVSGLDDAWTTATNDSAHLDFIRHCPPQTGEEFDGLVLQTRLNSVDSPLGSYAEYRLDAPPGTSISRLRLWREAGKLDNTWQLYTRTADGTDLSGSDCTIPAGQPSCQLGFPTGPMADWSALSTTAVRVGITCSRAINSCDTGATLNHAWTAIYGSLVTIEDPSAPTVAGPGGPLFAGGWLRGTVNATLASATDNTGIRSVRVLESSTVRAEAQQPCDYSRRIPCTNLATPATVALNTASLADGTHTLTLDAIDAAGNPTVATSQPVTVDNTAPLEPTPTSSTAISTTSSSTTVTWANPGGQVAPIAAARVTVCTPGGSCSETRQAPSGSATVALNGGYGDYRVSVALEDAAGNVDPRHATSWTVSYRSPDTPGPSAPSPPPAPAAPGTPPAAQPAVLASPHLTLAKPTVARDRRTITIRGSVANGVTGKVTVTATARIGNRTRTIRRTATIRSRRYRVNLKLPAGTWRTAKVSVRCSASATRRAATVTRRVRRPAGHR